MADSNGPLNLTNEERRSLLRLARKNLKAHIQTGNEISTEECEALIVGETCRQNLNCFVSLHQSGKLCGCIGTVVAHAPLFDLVASSAIGAGARDPRFSPVTLDELERCDFEISVLGPFRQIQSVDEIEIGLHGLLIDDRHRRGLLLPQVATKYGWSPRKFLEQTYRKANMPAKKKIGDETVSVFSACVFGENDYEDLAR